MSKVSIAIAFVILSFKSGTSLYEFPDLKFFPTMPVNTENPVTFEGADLGRHLFYDPILSQDSNMSCSSCHKQEFAFSDSPNQFSKGRNGELLRRNTMPLFNLAWYNSYFWDGKASSLEEQVFHPVRAENEMDLEWVEASERILNNEFYRNKFELVFPKQKIDSNLISKAIAQFLRTLISYQSKYDRVLSGTAIFSPDEKEGFILVNDQTKGDCLHCHTTDANALGTTTLFSNNGLDSTSDAELYPDKGKGEISKVKSENGQFKIPSLRNIALTSPYMHDGRFKTLEDVINFYSEGVQTSANIDSKMQFAHLGGVHLNDEEKRKILTFLLTLTDSTFIANPVFKNPFQKN